MSSDVSSGEAVNDGGRSETLMLSQVITESATTMTTERVESGDIHNDARTDEPMVVETTESRLELALAEIIVLADSRKKLTAARSSLRHISKILSKILKNPEDAKARRLKMKNFSVKKFVLDIPGSMTVLSSLGFVEDPNPCTLDLPLSLARNADVIGNAIELIQQKCLRVDDELNRPLESTGNVYRKQCVGKCGFFGTEEDDGYCSVCYRKRQTGVPIQPGPTIQTVSNSPWRRKWRVLRCVILAVVGLRRAVTQRPVQSDRRKCWQCRRKIRLTVVACQCGYSFCDRHRSTLDHECSFNFRRAHKLNLQRANPTVTGKKLHRLDD